MYPMINHGGEETWNLHVTSNTIQSLSLISIFLPFSETFPLLKATFKVERTFSYYLFRLYLPTSLLVMLTWATFWIPGKAVPARVTLVVTNFLSTMFILQSSASHIPKVTYTTALEVYLFTNVLFIIGVMLEYMVVLNYCPKRKVCVIVTNYLLADSEPI